MHLSTKPRWHAESSPRPSDEGVSFYLAGLASIYPQTTGPVRCMLALPVAVFDGSCAMLGLLFFSMYHR